MSGKSLPGKVFISYRIADTKDQAMSLHDFLASDQQFSKHSVFIDRRDIDWGEPWPDVLKGELDRSTAVLVLIGPEWEAILMARYEDALANPSSSKEDWVTKELERALNRHNGGSLPVLMPVLVNRQHLPDPSQVPQALKALVEQLGKFQAHAVLLEEEGYQRRLLYKLACDGRLRNPVAQRRAFEQLGELLNDQMTQPLLRGLAQIWKDRPNPPDEATDVPALISEFVSAIKRLPLPQAGTEKRLADGLREVAATLYLMTVDLGLVSLWSGRTGAMPITASDATTAVVAKAVALNMKLAMTERYQGEPRVARTHKLAVAEYGLDDDAYLPLLRQGAHMILEASEANPRAKPKGGVDNITDTHIDQAKEAALTDESIGLAHWLVFAVSDHHLAMGGTRSSNGGVSAAVAVRVAEKLGVPMVLHHHGKWNVLRYPPDKVWSRLNVALTEIDKLVN